MSCGDSLFGPGSQYIKTNNGDFIAIQGSDTVERLMLSDLRIPYKQLLKSKIILKPGQVNYLLNHLGLGDNATFLAMKVTYDSKSVIEDDNHIIWNFYDDSTKLYNIGQLMILTGNSTNKIKQIYLTNPNTKYPVTIDVMAAVIDDEYSVFQESISQIGTSFTHLTLSSIETYVPGTSIVILSNDIPNRPLSYISISDINSMERGGRVLVIENTVLGEMLLYFETEYDAQQSHSVLNYITQNSSAIIQELAPDIDPPIIYFYSNVGNTPSGSSISLYGSTQSPVNTSMGYTFSTTIELGLSGTISSSDIVNLMIGSASDNRDGSINIVGSNLNLDDITSTGTYSFTFSVSDIAGNSISSNINVNLYII